MSIQSTSPSTSSNKPVSYGLDTRSPEQQAAHTEKEANKRSTEAVERARQVEKESQLTLDHIRDEYEKESAVQAFRHQDSLESQRTQGYEQIRDLKRTQQAELRRMRRDGESEKSQLQEYYKNSIHHLEQHGQQEILNSEKISQQQITFARKQNEDQLFNTQEQHFKNMDQTRRASENQLSEMAEANQKELDRVRSGAEEAQLRSQKYYTEKYQSTLKQNQTALTRAASQAEKEINSIRDSSDHKISAYEKKQSDPFYNLVNLDAELIETDHQFIFAFTVPEYEQNHMSAFIKGNSLVVSGNRRNQETQDLGHGHTKNTTSYQSFSESIPLTWPVDPKSISRETEGNQIVFRVSKLNYSTYKPFTHERDLLSPPT